MCHNLPCTRGATVLLPLCASSDAGGQGAVLADGGGAGGHGACEQVRAAGQVGVHTQRPIPLLGLRLTAERAACILLGTSEYEINVDSATSKALIKAVEAADLRQQVGGGPGGSLPLSLGLQAINKTSGRWQPLTSLHPHSGCTSRVLT